MNTKTLEDTSIRKPRRQLRNLYITLSCLSIASGLLMIVGVQRQEKTLNAVTTQGIFRISRSMLNFQEKQKNFPKTNESVSNSENLNATNPGKKIETPKSEKFPLPNVTQESMSDVEKRLANSVLFGGKFELDNSRERIAVIVPFRNRWKQLPIFLRYMHPFLQNQNVSYTIFIISQNDEHPFNRASLLNIGYKEAVAKNYTCFLFHDVDLLPESDVTKYRCSAGDVIHYAELLSSMNYTRIYNECAGGVMSIKGGDFQKINGFSNSYWGWGGEDDDIYRRIQFYNLTFVHQDDTAGRYTSLVHKEEQKNENRFKLLKSADKRFSSDGLSSLKYDLQVVGVHKLYTMFHVKLMNTEGS